MNDAELVATYLHPSLGSRMNSKRCTSWVHTLQPSELADRVLQLLGGQLRASEVHAGQVRAGQHHAGQVRARHARFAQVRFVQVCFVQVRAIQFRASKYRTRLDLVALHHSCRHGGGGSRNFCNRGENRN